MNSFRAVLLISLVWLFLGYSYYPKWDKTGSEAAISWDVSGYYHYLPAVFIYHDLKQQDYMNDINARYLPSPAYDQSFFHDPSGHRINKYALGQAVMYMPFFLAAHAYAVIDKTYPADGYSKPYQFAIWAGSLIASVIGLILLRRILKKYFTDVIVAWTLLTLGLATNWVEYASISNAMNHTWLFMLLCCLVLFTIRFYEKKDWTAAFGIGISLGLAALIRPTEMIWILISLLWNTDSIRERISFFKAHFNKWAVIAVVIIAIVSLQMIYWKYVANEWYIYTYGEQKLNFLSPKLKRGLIGVNVGWWSYTPVMLLAMVGWIPFYKSYRKIFWPVLITSILAIYITLSWGYWETGGGLGQRNLIQIYPLLAFPLACVIRWFQRNITTQIIWILVLLVNVYYSMWWVHQAHKGGFFQAGHMTRAFFSSVVGRPHPDRDKFKLLDTNEYFKGSPQGSNTVVMYDFEQDTMLCSLPWPGGGRAACLDLTHPYIGPVTFYSEENCQSWVRFEADFIVTSREWDMWKYAQWIVQFYENGGVVKTNYLRLQRMIPEDNKVTHLFFDVKTPVNGYEKCVMTLWNADSQHSLLVDNLKISCFREDQ